MITTRHVKIAIPEKPDEKFNGVTTKTVKAGSATKPIVKSTEKPVSISTRIIGDVQDIADKKKRDDIMAERKLAMKDEKKIVMVEKEDDGKLLQRMEHEASRNGYSLIGIKVEAGKTIESKREEKKLGKTDEEFAREAGAKFVSTNIPIEHKIGKKKPWNKMNAKERKEYQKNRIKK